MMSIDFIINSDSKILLAWGAHLLSRENEPIPKQATAISISGPGQFLSTLALRYEFPLYIVSIPVTWFRVDEDEHLLGTK